MSDQVEDDHVSSCTVVTFKTTQGAISIELYSQAAPATCRHFASLAVSGKYDGTLFDRVIANFIIQGGAMPNAPPAPDEDEAPNGLKHVGAGVVGLAGGSQIYMTLSPQPKLDGKFIIFGRVYSGMDVLVRIAALAVDEQFRPFSQVKILSSDVQQLPRPTRPLVPTTSTTADSTSDAPSDLPPPVVRKKRNRDILQRSIIPAYGGGE